MSQPQETVSCKTCRVQGSLCITSYLRSQKPSNASCLIHESLWVKITLKCLNCGVWLFTAENEPGRSFQQLFLLSEVLRANFHAPGQAFIFHPSIHPYTVYQSYYLWEMALSVLAARQSCSNISQTTLLLGRIFKESATWMSLDNGLLCIQVMQHCFI